MKRRAVFTVGLLLSSSAWAQIRAPGQQLPRANPCSARRPYPPQLNDLLAQDIGLLPQPGSQWWKDWIRRLIQGVNSYQGVAIRKVWRQHQCAEWGSLLDVTIFRTGGKSITYNISTQGVLAGINVHVDVTKDGDRFDAYFSGRLDGVLSSAASYGVFPQLSHLKKFVPYDAPFQPREEVIPALKFWTRQYWLSLIELGEAVGTARPIEIKL